MVKYLRWPPNIELRGGGNVGQSFIYQFLINMRENCFVIFSFEFQMVVQLKNTL